MSYLFSSLYHLNFLQLLCMLYIYLLFELFFFYRDRYCKLFVFILYLLLPVLVMVDVVAVLAPDVIVVDVVFWVLNWLICQ